MAGSRNHRFELVGGLPLLLAAGCTTAPPGSHADALTRTRRAVHDLVWQGKTPGISYVQVTADGVTTEVHAGVADVVTRRPIDASTQYMAYSITKALTALAVLQLVEAGRMALDAPLERYFPGSPFGTATIRQLLAHTSGVPSPAPLDWFFVEGDTVDRDAALARVLRAHPEPNSPPGQAYRYSNVGYWLLERALESASGEDYGAYLGRHVFAPLGVDDDAASFVLPPPERLATGHIRQLSLTNWALYLVAPHRYWVDARGGWSRLARVHTFGRAYGGAYVTARALAAVLSDLLRADSRLLGAEALQRMFERQAAAGETLDSTLGWVVGELDGARYVGKQGGGLGFSGNVRVYPELGIATLYLANATQVMPGPIDTVSDRLDEPAVRWHSRARPRED